MDFEPSADRLTTCSDSALLATCGLMVALSSRPFSSTVPAVVSVVTLLAQGLGFQEAHLIAAEKRPRWSVDTRPRRRTSISA